MPLPRTQASGRRANAQRDQKLQIIHAVSTGLGISVGDIITSGNCDVSISASLVHHLAVERIPRQYDTSDEAVRRIMAAKGSLAVIYAQCQNIMTCNGARDEMTQLLASHYPGMLQWCSFFLRTPTPLLVASFQNMLVLCACHLLCMMVMFDDELAACLFSSPQVIRVVLKMWTATGNDGRHFFGSEEACPIIHLVKRVLLDESGRSTFLGLLYTTPSSMAAVIPTFRSRIQELSTSLSSSEALGTMKQLLQLVDILLHPRHEIPNDFTRPLHAPELAYDICHILHTVLHLDEANFSPQQAYDLVWFVSKEALGASRSPVKRVVAAMNGGLFCVIVKMYLSMPAPDPRRTTLLHIMKEMTAYTTYDGTVTFNAISHVPGAWVELASRCAKFEALWYLMNTSVVARAELTIREIEDPCIFECICNCTQHSQVEHAFSKERQSKKCSGCQAVLYCSRVCQAIDWNAGHRNECTELRMSRLSDAIPLRAQAMMILYVHQLIRYGPFDDVELLDQPRQTSVSNDRSILAIDVRDVPPRVGLCSLEQFKDRNRDHKSRPMAEYMTEFAEDREVCLVDAFFPWGAHVANMLVRFRKVGKRDFRALSATILSLLARDVDGPVKQSSIEQWSLWA